MFACFFFISSITNSAFHPYGVDKSSTNLPGWGEGGAVDHLCRVAGNKCNPIDKWRPVVLRWISRRTIRSFTFTFTFITGDYYPLGIASSKSKINEKNDQMYILKMEILKQSLQYGVARRQGDEWLAPCRAICHA